MSLSIQDFTNTQYKDFDVLPKSGAVNVRTMPGTDQTVLITVQPGNKIGIAVALYKTKKNGYNWYYVKLAQPAGGKTHGFVAGSLVNFIKNPQNTSTSTLTTNENNNITLSSGQAELNKLISDQKEVYKKIKAAYLILLNIKNGKVKANPNYNYQKSIQDLIKINRQYVELNNEIINKKEVVKVVDASTNTVKDSVLNVLKIYGDNMPGTQAFLHGLSVLGWIAIAVLGYISYEVYQWITNSRKKSRTIKESADKIIESLKANGVSEQVIQQVIPVVNQSVEDAYDAGKKEGEESGFLGKYKTPLIIIGSAAIIFMLLPYLEQGKERIQKLRKKTVE